MGWVPVLQWVIGLLREGGLLRIPRLLRMSWLRWICRNLLVAGLLPRKPLPVGPIGIIHRSPDPR